MILSVSRRSDIPAFYSKWLVERLKNGVIERVNPMNPLQVTRLMFEPHDINAVVLWTKNPAAFMEHVEELTDMGYRLRFLFTLNSYPEYAEPGLNSLEERIELFRELGKKLGKSSVAWRYDPVIFSNSFTAVWHLEQVAKIWKGIEGSTDRLIMSFYDSYRAPDKRMRKSSEFREVYRRETSRVMFLKKVNMMFKDTDVKLSLCAQGEDMADQGIMNGPCIDGREISETYGIKTTKRRDKSQRNLCLCTESFDIGAYDTCRYSCIYCYADRRGDISVPHEYKHDPQAPSLIPYKPEAKITIKDIRKK